MKTTKKLYKVFMALSITELNRFLKFVESPFFNQRADVKVLLQWMINARKKVSTFSRRVAYQVVYPNAEYEEKKMRLLISRLFKLLEEYLIISTQEKEEAAKEKSLLKAYRQLNLEQKFKQTWQAQQKRRQAQALRSAPYWHHQYEMEFAYYDYIGTQTREAVKIEEMANSFDIYLLAERLKIGCLQIAHQAVRNKEYDTEILEMLVRHVEKHPQFLTYPAIGIYYYWYKAISHKDKEVHYEQLYQLFEQYKHQFPTTERGNFHLLLLNYWIKQANTGNADAIEKAFELYHKGLEQGILLDNGHINDASFINVIALALRLPEKKDREKAILVENIINTFKDKLRPKDKENVILLNRARLAHYQGNYEEAMPLQAQIKSAQPFLQLLAATLLLKMYYEQDEIEPLEAHLKNMKNYLFRKKVLAEQHKINFLNIVQLTRQLIYLPPYDKAKRAALRQQILQTHPLGEREWLLKQLA